MKNPRLFVIFMIFMTAPLMIWAKKEKGVPGNQQQAQILIMRFER